MSDTIRLRYHSNCRQQQAHLEEAADQIEYGSKKLCELHDGTDEAIDGGPAAQTALT